jgi:hypothetical protein
MCDVQIHISSTGYCATATDDINNCNTYEEWQITQYAHGRQVLEVIDVAIQLT